VDGRVGGFLEIDFLEFVFYQEKNVLDFGEGKKIKGIVDLFL
jgi:hypothetical protein